MEIEKRIELEVKAATEIAQTLLSKIETVYGTVRYEIEREIPSRAAYVAHELVEMVLRNNRENLGLDESGLGQENV